MSKPPPFGILTLFGILDFEIEILTKMFYIFLIIFVIFTAIWGFFATSTIYHLKQYSLPGWSAYKIAMPVFFIISAAFFGFAVYFLFQVK